LFYDHSGFYWNKTLQTAHSINSSVIGYNVYITNDESKKKKDWCIDILCSTTYRCTKTCYRKNIKKIVLTADPDLFLDVKNVSDEFLEYFCNESNKNKSPLEFIQISDGKFIYPNQLKHWSDAFHKKTDIKANLKIEFVSQLNEDGTETDITDNPEKWFGEIKDDYSISDKKNPLYGNYLMNNLQEILSKKRNDNVDKFIKEELDDVFFSNISEHQKAINLIKIGINYQQNISLDDMQYYMEYCQRNGYIAPLQWLNNHKHY
jgi:hypothetical protein